MNDSQPRRNRYRIWPRRPEWLDVLERETAIVNREWETRRKQERTRKQFAPLPLAYEWQLTKLDLAVNRHNHARAQAIAHRHRVETSLAAAGELRTAYRALPIRQRLLIAPLYPLLKVLAFVPPWEVRKANRPIPQKREYTQPRNFAPKSPA